METQMKLNVTARAARWSAAHWKTATLTWLALVVAAVTAGTMTGAVNLTNSEQGSGESARAEAILSGSGFTRPAGESVLVQSKTQRVATDPVFGTTLATVVNRLKAEPQVTNVRRTQTSKDGHSVLVEFDLRGDPATADTRVQPVLEAVAALQLASPGYTVAEFGGASVNHQISDAMGKDLANAEQLSLPITFLILLIVFGAFVAAGLPVLLAMSAVLAAIGFDSLVSHLVHTTDAASSVILLIGMAVGVDYSLFYVKREREERRRGHGDDALIRAAGTSGMAVLVSGGTVMIAMAGMLISGSRIFTALGIASMLVVAIAVTGSLTVLPALLGKLGDRIDRGVLSVLAASAHRLLRLVGLRSKTLARLRDRRTFLQRAKGHRETSRAWDLVLKPVLRHPWLAAGVATWLLLLLAIPALSIHTKMPGLNDLSKSIPVVSAYAKIDKTFPGSQVPATVVVEARDVNAAPVKQAIAQLRKEAVATGLLTEPVRVAVNAQHTVARIDLPLRGNGYDASSNRAIATLRSTVLPNTIGRIPDVQHAVTGDTAGNADFNATIKHRFPYVFAFVLGLAFLLLLATFRSIVVPLTAIALNLLSVAASYGVLVWIFQQGHLEGLLGFHSNGGIVTWLPLFLFAVLFALSMDYHVFIVSRIKELVDRGHSTEDAVAEGIRTTASTVTSAAAVMVAVFAVFASLSSLDLKQMGVGLAVAVLLDATIIRGVLLPSTMKLLGRWNWYLPRTLGWLPHWSLEPTRPVTEVD
jgi:RND superfamily putative drug exporter